MSTTYAAHIITRLGDPEICVETIPEDQDSASTTIVATYPIPEGMEGRESDVLAADGWILTGEIESVDYGTIEFVRPVDELALIRRAANARLAAEVEYRDRDEAWRRVIADAMHDGASATKVADAALVSRERVYQIRDNRR